MTSLTRRALLRRIAASAGSALLLPLMSKLTHAAQPVTPRFVFILEGNYYEPVTVLDPAMMAAINQAATPKITTADRWWFSNYGHKSPLIVPSTQFANTKALGAIATTPSGDQLKAAAFSWTDVLCRRRLGSGADNQFPNCGSKIPF